MNNKGITMVELLITIVVMGILSAFSTIAANEIIDNVRQGGFVENGETFLNAAKQAYYMGSDIWDDDQVTLQELVDEGYVESISNDPWGKSYVMDETVFTIEVVDAATPNSIYIPSITLDNTNRYSGQNYVFEGIVVSRTATMGLRDEGPLREFNKSDIDFLDGSTNIVKEAIDSIVGTPEDETTTDDSSNDASDNSNDNDSTNNDTTPDDSNEQDTNNDDTSNDNDTEDEDDDQGGIIDTIIDTIFGDDDEDEEETGSYTSDNDTVTINEEVTSSNSIYALSGNDTITINGKVKNSAVIDLGEGNDKITITKSVDKSTITTGNGNDTVDIDDDVKNKTSITTGNGNDTVSIEEIKNEATVSTGSGNDNVYIRDISSSYKGTITLGTGNDYFRTDESSFKGIKGTFDGGEGNDTLYLLNVSEKDWNKTVSKFFTGFERIVLKDTTIG